MSPRGWSAEERERKAVEIAQRSAAIAADFRAGMTVRAIAAKRNLEPQVVYMDLRFEGIRVRSSRSEEEDEAAARWAAFLTEKGPVIKEAFLAGETIPDLAIAHEIEIADVHKVLRAQDVKVRGEKTRLAELYRARLPELAREWTLANPHAYPTDALAVIPHAPGDAKILRDALMQHSNNPGATRIRTPRISSAQSLQMRDDWLGDKSLKEIAQEVGMSSEGVRNAIERVDPDIHLKRAAIRMEKILAKDRRRYEDRVRLGKRVERWALANDMAVASDTLIAEHFNLTRAEVAQLRGLTGDLVTTAPPNPTAKTSPRYVMEDFVSAVREVAARLGVSRLTGTQYDAGRDPERHPFRGTMIRQRRWLDITQEAGLNTGRKKRHYDSISDEEAAAWVRLFLETNPGKGSSHYASWSEGSRATSHTLVLQRFRTWEDAAVAAMDLSPQRASELRRSRE